MRATCVHLFTTLSSSTSYFVMVEISIPCKSAISTLGLPTITLFPEPVGKILSTHHCWMHLQSIFIYSHFYQDFNFFTFLIARTFCSSPSLDFSAFFASGFLLSGGASAQGRLCILLLSLCPFPLIQPVNLESCQLAYSFFPVEKATKLDVKFSQGCLQKKTKLKTNKQKNLHALGCYLSTPLSWAGILSFVLSFYIHQQTVL